MKKIFVILGLAMLGLSAQAKDYKYEKVEGDMMQTRLYTLDNGLKVYLSVNNEKPPYSDVDRRTDGVEERSCRDHRSGSLSGAPDV